MKKLRVGILFGGRSGEHEVSLLSAASVLGAIEKSKYEVVPIGITKEGRWLTSAEAEKLLNGKTPEHEARHLRAGDPETTLTRRASDRGINVDIIFPVLHGTFGEDGTIQGLLELADIPYVGAGVL